MKFYLAIGPIEVTEQAQAFLKERALIDYYEEILIGALRLAWADLQRGRLDQQQALRIRDTVSEVVEDLETRRSPDRSPIGLRLQTSTDKFSQKVAELRNTDPLVDWSGVKSRPEARRLVAF